ncbi:MAG: amidohydrolase family protein [Bacteroidota bacterium]
MKGLLLLALALLLGSQLGLAQATYLHCGKLIDGVTDQAQTEMTVVVEGNTILRVEKGYRKPGKNERAIDLKDRTVMPGFIDLHVHIEKVFNKASYLERFTLNEADIAFRAAKNAKTTLMAGFTTVRDLGGTGVNIALRKAIARGIADGPRIYTAGQIIAITGGHGDPTNGYRKGLADPPGLDEGVANGPDECRAAVRTQVKNGADCIKITATGGVLSVARDGSRPQFTQAEIDAIVETANDYGIHVAAHAHGDEGMQRAIRGGVRTIEHGTFMSEATMDLMKARGTWYVPTITAGNSVADSAKIPRYFPDVITPKALHVGPQIAETFAKAYKKGVKIAFGTDAGVFEHGYNALEFALMVEGGMPPMEAIQCATMRAAEVLDETERLGSIEPGKLADIVACGADPLQDITALQNIRFVMKNGRVYKQE